MVILRSQNKITDFFYDFSLGQSLYSYYDRCYSGVYRQPEMLSTAAVMMVNVTLRLSAVLKKDKVT